MDELSNSQALWFPLFSKVGRRPLDPPHEVARLHEGARQVLDGEDLGATLDSAFFLIQCGQFQLAEAVHHGEVPAAAFAVLAGLAGVVAPNDEFTMADMSSAVWSLAAATKKATSVASALLPSAHATYPLPVDPWGRLGRRLTDWEGSRAPSTPEHLALVDQAAPLSVGGITFAALAAQRPVAWFNRHVSVEWEALSCAMDVFSGSVLARERIVALSNRVPDRAPLAWLAEVVLRLDRQPDAAERYAARVEARLAAGVFRNTMGLAGLEPYRDDLRRDPDGPGDAILHLAALPRRGRPRMKDQLGEDVHPLGPRLHRAARAGNDLAKALVAMEAVIEDDAIEVDWERDSQGPFHALFPHESLIASLNVGIDAMMSGFRTLYALELLEQAMPTLGAWLAREGS